MCTICKIQYFKQFLTKYVVFHVKSDLYIINIPEKYICITNKKICSHNPENIKSLSYL